MWTAFTTACRASLPFFIDNLIPLVNFVALLCVILAVQQIRADLRRRTKRFERIEAALQVIHRDTDGRD